MADRALTVADRLPEKDDALLWVDDSVFHAWDSNKDRITVRWAALLGWRKGTIEMSEARSMRYLSRADGGPVTVTESACLSGLEPGAGGEC